MNQPPHQRQTQAQDPRHDEDVAQAFTARQIEAVPAGGDGLRAALRRSYGPARRGDVVFVLEPDFVDKPGVGPNHGTPYPYDTHGPLLWYGSGVSAGAETRGVGVNQIAATLGALLKLPKPPAAAPDKLF